MAAHLDGSVLLYDKEREDAPLVSEEDLQHPSPALRKGFRQPRLLVRKSSKSINQKTNPVAVYKVARLRLTDMRCSPDGRFVAVTSEDGTLRIIDLLREAYVPNVCIYELLLISIQAGRSILKLLWWNDVPRLVSGR